MKEGNKCQCLSLAVESVRDYKGTVDCEVKGHVDVILSILKNELQPFTAAFNGDLLVSDLNKLLFLTNHYHYDSEVFYRCLQRAQGSAIQQNNVGEAPRAVDSDAALEQDTAEWEEVARDVNEELFIAFKFF